MQESRFRELFSDLFAFLVFFKEIGVLYSRMRRPFPLAVIIRMQMWSNCALRQCWHPDNHFSLQTSSSTGGIFSFIYQKPFLIISSHLVSDCMVNQSNSSSNACVYMCTLYVYGKSYKYESALKKTSSAIPWTFKDAANNFWWHPARSFAYRSITRPKKQKFDSRIIDSNTQLGGWPPVPRLGPSKRLSSGRVLKQL